eukprot:g16652.t1
MGRRSGLIRFRGPGGGAAVVLLASALLSSGRTDAQDSCVQVFDPSFVSSDAGGDFTFTMEGTTTVTSNVVNLAIIVDASGTVDDLELADSIDFAKATVAAFAEQNLFENGGTASYAQFASSAQEGATFTSQLDFDNHVDTLNRISGGTRIDLGVAEGRRLLAAAPEATASFMVVITDGDGGDPADESNAARDEGIILFAVGVGGEAVQATLLAIAGEDNPDNVFDVDNFDQLGGILPDILSESEGIIPCPSTDATVTVEFNAAVVAASVDDTLGSATVDSDGSTVVFVAPDLEENPVRFTAMLDYCGVAEGTDIVAAVSYSDNERNSPDLSTLQGAVTAGPICGELLSFVNPRSDDAGAYHTGPNHTSTYHASSYDTGSYHTGANHASSHYAGSNDTGTNHASSHYTGANHTSSHYTDANHIGTNYTSTNHTGTNHASSHYAGANHTGTYDIGTDHASSYYTDTNYTGTNYTGANHTRTYDAGTNHVRAFYTGTNYIRSYHPGANHTGTHHASSYYTGTNYTGTNYTGANNTRTNHTGTYDAGSNHVRSCYTGANYTGACLTSTNHTGTNYIRSYHPGTNRTTSFYAGANDTSSYDDTDISDISSCHTSTNHIGTNHTSSFYASAHCTRT